jgi:uncharacterized protein with HEPN domain
MTLHDPMVRVRHMLDYAREAVEMVHNRSRPDLDKDRMLNLALLRLMEIIGEAASRIPEDFRSIYKHIRWRDIVDLRNRLIHGYDSVDFDILWAILHDDLPKLVKQLESIIAEASLT